MKAHFQSILLSLFLTLSMSFTVAADEVTDVIDDVAAKLVQQLPLDKRILLKSLSPDQTGLPEDFLRKLTSDLESALLTASNFEINLANRLSMEEIWQEAVEFNNADFEELFKGANADVLLMMSPRAISTGVEVAITAYALTGDNVGKTLASSGSVLLPIDLRANLGVDVNDLNKQMVQVLAEIKKVGQTGGLISSPNTYAKFYHNARILQQRGEVDLAVNNYIETLRVGSEEGLSFFDPLLDLIILAITRYGEKNALKFLNLKVSDYLTEPMHGYIKYRFNLLNELEMRYQIASKSIAPMSLHYWIKHQGKELYLQRMKEINPNTRLYGESKISEDYILLSAVREILKIYNREGFSELFIDDIRAAALIDVAELEEIESRLNRVEVSLFSTRHSYGSGGNYFDLTKYAKIKYPTTSLGRAVALARMENSPFVIKGVDKEILLNGLRVEKDSLGKVLGNSLNSDEFEGGAWCSSKRHFSMRNFWQSLPKIFETDFEVSSFTSPWGKANKAQNVSIFTDRLLWADVCANLHYNKDFKVDELVPVWGLHNLIITDEVDLSKPVILEVETPKSCNTCLPRAFVDISKDGTYFNNDGVPPNTYFAPMDSWYQNFSITSNTNYENCGDSFTTRSGCEEFGDEIIGNNWAYAPGIIQSSIFTDRLISVDYTTLSGESRLVNNIYFNISGYVSRDINGADFEPSDISDIINSASQLGYSNSIFGSTNIEFNYGWKFNDVERSSIPLEWRLFYQRTIGEFVTPVAKPFIVQTCAIARSSAEIKNVQNYTNLRQKAGLNGQVIGQVPLGATVSVVSPGSFLRYDRCAAACDGTNQNTIKQCIDNNDVWIKVQHNGRSGFLSRKFLE